MRCFLTPDRGEQFLMNYAFLAYLGDIDLALFHAINSFCGQNPILDNVMSQLGSSQLKGLALMSTFGVLWFQRTMTQDRQRETLLLVLLAVVISLVMARGLAAVLPFRLRPMFTSGIGYRTPFLKFGADLEDWSSFPSDNATGFWLVSRWWGVLWTCFSIMAMISRVYFGFHYPGDVFAGALIGIGVTIAINNEFMHTRIAASIVAVERRAPAIFYGLLFPLIYEISTIFGFTRGILHGILHLYVFGG
jgi:undecaprenyl-diphosphatase